MRLIDADALKEKAWAADVEYLINSAPTIDAEPVRHARWEKDKDDVFWGNHFIHKRCSKCGKEPPVSRFGTGYALSRYCPNCGAKMDLEV